MKKLAPLLISLSLLTALVFNSSGMNIFELPKIQFLAVFLAVTLITITFYMLKKGKITTHYNKYVYLFLLLWLLSLTLSTCLSQAPLLSFFGNYDRFQGLYSHLIYLSFFLLFLNILKTNAQQKTFLITFTAIVAIVSIHAILQQFGIGIYQSYAMEEFLNRSFSTLGHPNMLGQFLIIPTWIAIYFIITQKKKIIPILTTLLLITGLILSQNRGSILGMLIGAILIGLITIKIKPIYKYLITASGITAFLAFILYFAPSLRSLFTRFYLWEGAIKLFPDNPIFGSGLETFKLAFQKVASPELFGFEKLYEVADRSHNMYLDILVEQGLFGLIIFIVIILSLLYLFIKNIKNKNPLIKILFAALISILVTSFFSFHLTAGYISIMVLVALFLNNTAKFKKFEIKRNIVTIFISGIIFAISILTINYSIKTIYADILFEKGITSFPANIPQAVLSLENAVKTNPYQSDISYYYGDSLTIIGKEMSDPIFLKQADVNFEHAGNFTNKDFVYHLLKGRLYTYMEKYDEAETIFQNSKNIAPQNPLILTQWANLYFQKGDYQKAIDKDEYLLSLFPEYWKWKIDLDSRPFEEQEKYRLFIKHIPNLNEIFTNLQKSYENLGNTEKSGYYKQFTE